MTFLYLMMLSYILVSIPFWREVGEGDGGVRLPARSKICFLAQTGSFPMLNL
jgi:hypothetical protein